MFNVNIEKTPPNEWIALIWFWLIKIAVFSIYNEIIKICTESESFREKQKQKPNQTEMHWKRNENFTLLKRWKLKCNDF